MRISLKNLEFEVLKACIGTCHPGPISGADPPAGRRVALAMLRCIG